MDGNDTGHDGDGDAAIAHPVEISEVHLVVEEELGDGGRRAGIDLLPKHVDIGIDGRRLWMLLRIAGDRHVERRNVLDAAREVGGIDIAARGRHIILADAAGWVAAQRHDMADTDVPIVADHGIDLFARRVNAGEMSRRLQLRLLQHAGDRGVGALAGGTTGAIGDGNIARPQRLKPADRAPQRLLHGCRARRKELERHVDVAVAEEAALAVWGGQHHAANSTEVRFFLSRETAGFKPTQSETVSFSCPTLAAGARSRCRSTATPASFSQRLICSGAKPRRRWADSRAGTQARVARSRPPEAYRRASRAARLRQSPRQDRRGSGGPGAG